MATPIEHSSGPTTGQPGRPVVSAAVVTHPRRLVDAQQVAARLAPLDPCIAVDPDPAGQPGALRSARLAFAATSSDSSHHVVLQDDVAVSDHFLDAVGRTAELYPGAAVGFFVEWGSPTATMARWAAFTGATAVPVVNTYVPTQALAVPSTLSRRLARFLREECRIGDADDEQILRFLRRTGTRTLVVVPNLVEHLELPCTTGHAWQGVRRSVCWRPDDPVGERPVVLDVPGLVPFFQWTVGLSLVIHTEAGVTPDWRPTVDVLGEWGAGPRHLRSAYRAGWPSSLDREVLEHRIGTEFLFQLWVTAAAMGAIQAQRWPSSLGVLDRLTEHPVAAHALRTMAPGALRRVVGLDFVADHADELDALLVEAMRFGAGLGW